MKKSNLFFALGAIALMGVFSNCSKDTTANPPVVKFTNDVSTYAATSGGSYTIVGTITSDVGLTDVTFTKVTDAGETQLLKVTDFTDKKAYTIMFLDSNITVAHKVKVTATDKNGSTSLNFSITVAAGGTALATEKTGVIYHIQASSGNGAWDLVADVKKMSGDAATSKDMIQASNNVSGSAWVAGWNVGAGCGTTYVKASASFDYTTATVESTTAAYTGGTSTASVTGVANGDIYIAKLRGGSDYAVIKITTVDPNDASQTAGSNKGSITFSYKKK
jgi:hypothetical protein